MISLAIITLIISFYLLAIICEEYFVEALDIISHKLNLSSDVAGATFMAVGSSAPELFTSLIAVLKPGEHADIGSGTIVGSALFNILVIIGVAALHKRAHLNWQPIVRDTLFYSLSIIILLFAFQDGQIVLNEAIIFVGLYVIYIIAVINWKKFLPYKNTDPIKIVEKQIDKNKISKISKQLLNIFIPDIKKNPQKYPLVFVISLILIGMLSYTLVESAIVIAQTLHIPAAVIALTILAIGTSIPDLISSSIVAKQGRGDMAVSNAVGSNIFDILFGLGVPWLIILTIKGGSVSVSTTNLEASIILLFASVLALFFLLAIRKWSIGRRGGLVLITLYLTYLIYTLIQVI